MIAIGTLWTSKPLKMKKINFNLKILTLIFLIVFTKNSYSSISKDFINNITAEATNILSSEETETAKIEKLVKIGEKSVDIEGIGFYTLGKHRKSLNDDQKKNIVRFLEHIF